MTPSSSNGETPEDYLSIRHLQLFGKHKSVLHISSKLDTLHTHVIHLACSSAQTMKQCSVKEKINEGVQAFSRQVVNPI